MPLGSLGSAIVCAVASRLSRRAERLSVDADDPMRASVNAIVGQKPAEDSKAGLPSQAQQGDDADDWNMSEDDDNPAPAPDQAANVTAPTSNAAAASAPVVAANGKAGDAAAHGAGAEGAAATAPQSLQQHAAGSEQTHAEADKLVRRSSASLWSLGCMLSSDASSRSCRQYLRRLLPVMLPALLQTHELVP